jgi:Ni,Fe-hydrogenase I small subunit
VRRPDGGGDELRGLRVDGDVPAEQHAAVDAAALGGQALRQLAEALAARGSAVLAVPACAVCGRSRQAAVPR